MGSLERPVQGERSMRAPMALSRSGDALVTSIDLLHVVDDAGALSAEGRDQQGYAGPDVGAGHADRPERGLEIVADDRRPVRIAQDDLRARLDELLPTKNGGSRTSCLMHRQVALGLVATAARC